MQQYGQKPLLYCNVLQHCIILAKRGSVYSVQRTSYETQNMGPPKDPVE